MSDDTADELARYLNYARLVDRVLPIDEEAQRRVDRLMAEAARRGPPPRKLARKP